MGYRQPKQLPEQQLTYFLKSLDLLKSYLNSYFAKVAESYLKSTLNLLFQNDPKRDLGWTRTS